MRLSKRSFRITYPLFLVHFISFPTNFINNKNKLIRAIFAGKIVFKCPRRYPNFALLKAINCFTSG